MNAVARQQIGARHVVEARTLVSDALAVSEGFPSDPRLEQAQIHLVAALAEIIRFQNDIGGPR